MLIITTNFKAKASKVENSQELKRKLKIDSIGNIKKQKLQLQECINSLKEGFESETLAADENQDLSSFIEDDSIGNIKKQRPQCS